ncbi:MAG: RsmD family RNA methyltransferase [Phycisphaeraceae bacterium]
MRIIGGNHRSRRIQPPQGTETTRPITDRVKVALFDRLDAAGLVEEGYALDLFCGTGSLGLEALSRGSEHCTFIESHRGVREILESNIHLLGLEAQSRVMSANALATAWIAMLPHKPLRIVFCDPPYSLMEDERTRGQMMTLIAALLPDLEPGGVVMLRTPTEVTPDAVEGYMDMKRHEYGSMALHFYQKPL